MKAIRLRPNGMEIVDVEQEQVKETLGGDPVIVQDRMFTLYYQQNAPAMDPNVVVTSQFGVQADGDAYLFDKDENTGELIDVREEIVMLHRIFYLNLEKAKTERVNSGVEISACESKLVSKSAVFDMQLILGMEISKAIDQQTHLCAQELIKDAQFNEYDYWFYCLALDHIKEVLLSQMDARQRKFYEGTVQNVITFRNNGGMT